MQKHQTKLTHHRTFFQHLWLNKKTWPEVWPNRGNSTKFTVLDTLKCQIVLHQEVTDPQFLRVTLHQFQLFILFWCWNTSQNFRCKSFIISNPIKPYWGSPFPLMRQKSPCLDFWTKAFAARFFVRCCQWFRLVVRLAATWIPNKPLWFSNVDWN